MNRGELIVLVASQLEVTVEQELMRCVPGLALLVYSQLLLS
jgi:hypothetical protein